MLLKPFPDTLDHNLLYQRLRSDYSVFSFDDFSVALHDDCVVFRFFFSIDDKIKFQPTMQLFPGKYKRPDLSADELKGIAFHIGLIELISYWKSTCCKIIRIVPFSLSAEQRQWWRKLYWKGLGEFFYQNRIVASERDFFSFAFDDNAPAASDLTYPFVEGSDSVIVPVGGGKDSVVTMEELRAHQSVIPFIINPRGATVSCAEVAGFRNPEDRVILKREIDPALLTLNKMGCLNGHTPFSAMLAFYSLAVSYVTGTREVALSNEASANEPTIPGTDINHQYSKSFEFEKDFQNYVRTFMNDGNHYYSYLRNLSELQIAEKFSHYTQYHTVFRSCNAGSKEDKWCCNCSKCLFAYIILSPFIEDKKMIEIFGEDLLNKPSLKQFYDELTGVASNKPFECVGTINEVNQAVKMIKKTRKNKFLLS